MMIKLAIIDLDGVVADNTKRFEKAEEAKQAYLKDAEEQFQLVLHQATAQREATKLFWQTAFTPDLVKLDTLIEGAKEALDTLEAKGYHLALLTSRPETMRQATLAWIDAHKLYNLAYDRPLIMKPSAAQFVKTVTWKALTVQMLASLFEASEVLFVDDEQANRDIVMDSYLDGSIDLIVASSLAEALEKLEENQ